MILLVAVVLLSILPVIVTFSSVLTSLFVSNALVHGASGKCCAFRVPAGGGSY